MKNLLYLIIACNLISCNINFKREHSEDKAPMIVIHFQDYFKNDIVSLEINGEKVLDRQNISYVNLPITAGPIIEIHENGLVLLIAKNKERIKLKNKLNPKQIELKVNLNNYFYLCNVNLENGGYLGISKDKEFNRISFKQQKKAFQYE